MDSFSTQSSTMADTGFQARVRQAVLAQAIVVSGEASDVYNHQNRLAWSATVLRALSADDLALTAGAVASDGLTTNASTDAQILARVAAIWDALSGVL